MKMNDEFDNLKDKKVFLVLKSGMIYNGVVKETTENFLFLKDKFDNKVTIRKDEVANWEERE